MADLFDCFGDEEEDQTDDPNSIKRAESCGVFSFHNHTEKALVAHLQSALKHQSPTIKEVLSAVDDFCLQRHWMMHIGPDKGSIVNDILENEIQRFLQTVNVYPRNETKCIMEFSCVELGTYCAYSSILMGSVLQKYTLAYPNIRFHLYTFEIQPEILQIANTMVTLAQLQNIITVVPINLYLDGSIDDISVLTTREMHKRNSTLFNNPQIHFLFIDHDKDRYLSDLKALEFSGLIQQGTCVVADNVIFAQIDDYLLYMRALQDKNIVMTNTIDCVVEYSHTKNIKDGIEFTSYIQDPALNVSKEEARTESISSPGNTKKGMMIRSVQTHEIDKLIQLGENTGIFGPGESKQLLGDTLICLLNNTLPTGHQAHVLERADGVIVGWLYFGPTDDSDIWNLWWIGIEPQFHGNGHGKMLLKFFEEVAVGSGAKTAIVETSSIAQLKRTREFYTLQGYIFTASETDGYGPGEDKIIFSKQLSS